MSRNFFVRLSNLIKENQQKMMLNFFQPVIFFKRADASVTRINNEHINESKGILKHDDKLFVNKRELNVQGDTNVAFFKSEIVQCSLNIFRRSRREI